jgi:hypothetical protein
VNRRLPSAIRIARLVLLAEVVAAAAAYALWRWIDARGTVALHTPASLRMTELGLAVGAVLVAGLLLRSLVYRGSSWQPSLPLALVAAVATPPLGAWLLRDALVREAASRPQLAGMALPHRSGYGRMGDTKRLNEL